MTPDNRPVIQLANVTKTFDGRTVLDDLSFEVCRGRAFCLLGRSGTGKSVTLRHIVGLVRPDRGRVLVEGENVPDLSRPNLNQLRRRIGFLFQNAALFDSITVGENVAFPLRRHTRMKDLEIRECVRERLAEVGLQDEYDRMPAALSGGMRKRAGLARAMVLDPAVLLVDEPSAGLDPITTDEIDRLLLERKAQSRVTMVVVTHNIPSARTVGDELALLDGGRLVARGTARELEASDIPIVRDFMRSAGGG
jgi:phospholipid/cholesterol/gamma-HCH transport system ATP-binding protein